MNTYPNPQSFVNSPEPPRRKIRPWMWITGGALVLVIALGWFAVSFGKKIGSKMREGMDVAQHHADSVKKADDAARKANYESILGIVTTDSVYLDIQNRVTRLRQNTEAIREMIALTKDSFAAFLPDSSTLTMLNKGWSEKYFIKSGRAKTIKRNIETYVVIINEDMPEGMEKDSLSFFSVTAIMQNSAPDMLKNMLSWEKMMFEQPPTSVYTNLKIILRDIDTFEYDVLEKYLEVPTPSSSVSDSAKGI